MHHVTMIVDTNAGTFTIKFDGVTTDAGTSMLSAGFHFGNSSLALGIIGSFGVAGAAGTTIDNLVVRNN